MTVERRRVVWELYNWGLVGDSERGHDTIRSRYKSPQQRQERTFFWQETAAVMLEVGGGLWEQFEREREKDKLSKMSRLSMKTERDKSKK